MKAFIRFLFPCLLVILFCSLGSAWAQAKKDPDVAFDPVNNRYLMVWEDSNGTNSDIKGHFRNVDGTAVVGSDATLSPARTTQGCFYASFDKDNGDVSTPTHCPLNKNPAVTYNNGQYIIVWEVRGTAAVPASAPDNQFINIFARIVDATTLNPLPGWEEGLLISKVQIAGDAVDSECGGKHACNDSQIISWGQALNPDVAPSPSGNGFVVTWQTNKDYIACADPVRRKTNSVYSRYIDQNFSSAASPIFAVYHDSSSTGDTCEDPSNVNTVTHPRIAANQTTSDLVIVYEVARASGGNAAIGAKQVTLDASNVGQVSGNLMPSIVASVDGKSLNNPDVVSFKDKYDLFASDGTDIVAESFSSSSITLSAPAAINLGAGTKLNPRASSNLGSIGKRPAGANTTPERLVITYEQGEDIFAAILNESLAVAKAPINVSTGKATSNVMSEVASDFHNFVAVWNGQSGGDNVFAVLIDSGGVSNPTPTPKPTPKPTPTAKPTPTPTAKPTPTAIPTPTVAPNTPPTAPVLGAQPADGVTWAPTRLYLSWTAATDPDVGDTVSYEVYFAVGASPGAVPYKSGLTTTSFVIQASTDGRASFNPNSGVTPIYLAANQSYAWKVCAKDNHGASTCSATRTFHTDNSVVGWWRFDENPTGPVCAGGAAGETVCDYSGKGNHGALSGSPVWLPPPNPGILGGELQFDGVDDNAVIQNDVSLNFANSLTISCKLNPKYITINTEILTKDFPTAGPYSLLQTTTNTIQFGIYSSGTWKYAVANVTSIIGTDFRATGIYDGVNTALYINNTLAQSTPTTGSLVSNSDLLKIGYSPFSNSYYNGAIDECFILNKVVNTNEQNNIVSTD